MPHKDTENFGGFFKHYEDCSIRSFSCLTKAKLDLRRVTRELRRLEAKPGGVVLAARGLSEEEEQVLDLFMESHDAVVWDSVMPGKTTHLIVGFDWFDAVQTFSGIMSLAARIPVVSGLWLLKSLDYLKPLDDYIIPVEGARRKEPLFNDATFLFSPEVPEDVKNPFKKIIEAASGTVVDSKKLLKKSPTNLKILLLKDDTSGESDLVIQELHDLGRGNEGFGYFLGACTKNGVTCVPVSWIVSSLIYGTTSLPDL